MRQAFHILQSGKIEYTYLTDSKTSIQPGKGKMNTQLREVQKSDLPFLKEILYEAVFWRASVNKPSFEEGLALPDVRKSLADWGERAGDAGVLALLDSKPVGAAWYRFWNDKNNVLGYIEENIPVLVIGVHKDYRRRGIGTKLLPRLFELASERAVGKISLNVSKDNYAKNLYVQQGFQIYADKGDAFTMVIETQ